MRSARLGVLLLSVNLGIALLAIVLVGAVGVALLGRLAGENALRRVELAGAGAAQAIELDGERLLASARLLGERPTLNRLLEERDRAGIESFLETFRGTSALGGCAVLFDGEIASSIGGEALPWREMLGAKRAESGWFLFEPKNSPHPILVSCAEAARVAGAVVGAAVVLDEAHARGTAEKVGVPVAIVGRTEIESEAGGARGALRVRALSGTFAGAARIDEGDLFVAAAPLRDPTGRVAGAIEAILPAREIDSSVGNLVRELVLLALVVVALATVFSLVLARIIERPIRSLTESAIRIGQGNFGSPVPRVGGVEISVLAGAMEEMRERVLRLTNDLRMRRAEAEAILTGIVEGVFAVDRERRIRYMNPQAAALLGVRAEEAIGRFCGDVLKPRERNGARPCEESCPILHARFRGKARATELLEPIGEESRSVVITSAPSGAELDETAADTLQYQVIRDETEVEATRRLRDFVLANISHEFRTPLSAQLASLELLRDRLPDLDPGEVRELVLSIERGTLRLTRLIDNLLESTRIEAGQDSIRRRPCALDEIIEEAVELMVPLIKQRKQTVEVDLPYPLPPVDGDTQRLVQVFVNLLANANKFSPAGGAIAIGGEVRGAEVRIWVEDQGPGLPSGTVESLFRRFMRAPDEEPEPRGMGLGLYIVKSIVERHGGRVEAESLERGTRMCVVLPRGDGHEDPGGR
ncbi:MAG: PAS domain-containing protein [Candidatus Eisenbacteria bacterium]|nr:PAS domain-containing protein [Candidatus Eisenbacteria bacterium]